VRLAMALLGAVVLHGVVFGLGLALLPHRAASRARVSAVDVDVVPARPDPVAARPASPTEPAPPPHPPRHRRRAEVPPALAPATAVTPALARVPAGAPPLAPAPALAPVPAGAPAAPDVTSRAAAPASPALAGRAGGAVPAGRAGPAPAAPVASLSAQPRYRTNPAPDYPVRARRLREEGLVYVRVAVTDGGLPAAVTVERGCGHPLLDDAALEAVRRWTFEPARAAGTPVASLVVVPVRFSLSDAR